MKMTWRSWKIAIGAALGFLLVADAAVGAVYYWQSQQTPSHSAAEAQALNLQAKKLRADVERGDKIKASLAKTTQACDAFYASHFLDADTGYSVVQADLSTLASQSGLRTASRQFKPKDLKGRNVTEVDIEDTVEGDYPAILQFINGLEVSPKFYVLRELTLDAVSTGGLRLKMQLATYFRK